MPTQTHLQAHLLGSLCSGQEAEQGREEGRNWLLPVVVLPRGGEWEELQVGQPKAFAFELYKK